MTARHRVSKLLLRQGIVYSGGTTWNRDHERWLRAQRFDNPALQLTFEAAFDAMLACRDRRTRLDDAITHGVREPLLQAIQGVVEAAAARSRMAERRHHDARHRPPHHPLMRRDRRQEAELRRESIVGPAFQLEYGVEIGR